jgi:hypothetical protein
MGLKIVIPIGYQRVKKISLTAMPSKGESPLKMLWALWFKFHNFAETGKS